MIGVVASGYVAHDLSTLGLGVASPFRTHKHRNVATIKQSKRLCDVLGRVEAGIDPQFPKSLPKYAYLAS